jgi:putative MFS transporter
MIGLVLVQILVVWAWGVEPNQRSLEEVEQAAESGTPRPATV